MVRGERHLRRADQEQVVGLQPVDLAGVRAEEAGALHRLRLDQHRRDHRGEAVLDRLRDGQLQQPELQQRAEAGQVVEPAAARPWRRARCRSRRSASPSSRWSRGFGDRRACRRPRAARRSRPRRRAARRPRPRSGTARCAWRSAASASVDGGLGRLHLGRRAPWYAASSAAFSSPAAFGICLPSCFCSARRASKRCTARAAGLVGARAARRRRTRTRPGRAGWHGRCRGLPAAGAGQSRTVSLLRPCPRLRRYRHPGCWMISRAGVTVQVGRRRRLDGARIGRWRPAAHRHGCRRGRLASGDGSDSARPAAAGRRGERRAGRGRTPAMAAASPERHSTGPAAPRPTDR